MKRTTLSTAIAEWKRVVGASRVRVSPAELRESASATYEVNNRVTAIVRPRTRAQVQECVRIAARLRVPIYPISRGKNFGYGSGAPTQDQSVIFDLSSMKRLELDRELAAVTVEPGVTNAELASYLAKHAPELVASLPGGTSPHASPMGNALDGGVGSGAYNDRFSHVYSIEVVLGTGEILRTGLDRYEGGARLGHTEARVGPTLRELFLQSNFGVVTSITFGLFPMPDDLRVMVVPIPEGQLADFVEKLRPLARSNVFTSMLSFFNDTLTAMSLLGHRYPWALAQGRAPLPRDVLAQFRESFGDGFPSWAATIDLLSIDRAYGDAREAAIRRALPGFAITTTRHSRATRKKYWHPHGGTLSLAYWRKTFPAPRDVDDIDPHRDACGLVWCDFVMPTDPKLFDDVARHVRSIVRSHGFEFTIKAHTFWPRAIYFAVILLYDRTIRDADARAERCDRAIAAHLSPLGVLPNRRRVGTMDLLAPTVDDSSSVLARIRKTLDPSEVIAPGRYDAGTARRQRTLTKTPPPDIAVEAAETIHRSLIEKFEVRGEKLQRTETHPLRPYFTSRSTLDRARDSARALLPALTAGARALLSQAQWRNLLGIDEALARSLHAQLERGRAMGKLEGAFDTEDRYRVFGFSSSVGSVKDSVEAAHESAPAGWKSPLSIRELRTALRRSAGDTIGVVRTERDRELVSFIEEHARKHVPLSARGASLAVSRRGPRVDRLDALYAANWRGLLSNDDTGRFRAAILGGAIATNASSDLVLGTLALLALLTDPKARPPLKSELAEAVERHLPWTRVLRKTRTTYRGKSIDLPSFVHDHREDFVLRPLLQNDEPPLFGAFAQPADWSRAIRRALGRTPSHVVQERVTVHQEVFPLATNGLLEFEGCYVITELVVIDSKIAAGCIVRIGERPAVGARSARSHLVPALVRAGASA